ncbi:hypothetical protein G6O45_25305, partial [Salmonella enterica subsp. enterica serovar Istanbul]|nr:hypothetical protein [Salmonella enterica subsp. enterica serovar Istanbul]
IQRCAEAIFVRGLVDGVLGKSPDHAICVLGDLNDGADSLPVRIVRGVGEPSKETLLPCAETLAPERRYSVFNGNEKVLIDHILVSDRLFRVLKSFEIYNEN